MLSWCFVVEAGMDVWRRRCWRGSALQSRRSSNGETVHFEPLEIQRHQDAGFTQFKTQAGSDRTTENQLIVRTAIASAMEQQKQLQSLTNEYQSLQNGMPPRDRDRSQIDLTKSIKQI
jgi:hypothetical protein